MIREPFPSQLTLRIDWSHLDLFGHVNNVSYFTYIQASRVHYWEQTGLSHLYQQEQKGLMLAAVDCQFRAPLHYPGQIIVEAKIEFVKNKSFGLYHRVWDQHGNLAAEAKDVMVMYDFKEHKTIAIPTHILNAFEQFEQKPIASLYREA